MESCADLSLRLNHRAWAVLHLLANMSPEFAKWNDDNHEFELYLRTYAWYNGRERGIALVLQRHVTEVDALQVVFAECRSSDEVIVEYWVSLNPFNGPTPEPLDEATRDARDAAHAVRQEFKSTDEAARHVYSKLKAYYTMEGEFSAE
jgi:hypothetical protein